MIKISVLFLLASLTLLSAACATSDKEPEFEPGCLDVIICSEPAPENHSKTGMY